MVQKESVGWKDWKFYKIQTNVSRSSGLFLWIMSAIVFKCVLINIRCIRWREMQNETKNCIWTPIDGDEVVSLLWIWIYWLIEGMKGCIKVVSEFTHSEYISKTIHKLIQTHNIFNFMRYKNKIVKYKRLFTLPELSISICFIMIGVVLWARSKNMN